MKDYFGVEIQVGDLVVYGKSSRDNPVGVGIVQDVIDSEIEVMGLNNSKPGIIRSYRRQDKNCRIIVLPDDYKELV